MNWRKIVIGLPKKRTKLVQGPFRSGKLTAEPAIQRHSRNALRTVVGVISGTVALAHFARFREFGLYEDDYLVIAPHLYQPVSRLWQLLAEYVTSWPSGRPLSYFLPAALSVVGSKLGGLEGVYVLAAVWLCVNGALVFLIVRRVLPETSAVVAALVYVLFPADTTKILLVNVGIVQASMTFLLLAIWLWMKTGPFRAISYGVAALTLLTYETALLPFIGVPFLWAGDRRTTIRVWTLHILACIGIIACVLGIRLAKDESRATEAVQHIGLTLYRMGTSLFIGPFTSGKSFFTAAVTGWHYLDQYAVLVGLLIIVGLLAGRHMELSGKNAPTEAIAVRWPWWLNEAGSGRGALPWWWLLLGAIIVWCWSYALTLVNYPPTVLLGRPTSTHVAAAWPVSLAIAAGFEGIRQRGHRWHVIGAGLFCGWLMCIAAHHQYIQRGFVGAWHLQQNFWRQVTSLVPNAGPGWTVIVEGIPAGDRDKRPVIFANSWADYDAYQLILATHLDLKGPAFAHLGNFGSLIQFRRVHDAWEWRPMFWGGPFVPIDPQRLVLLYDDHGTLRRIPEITTSVGTLKATTAVPAEPISSPSTPVSRLLLAR